MFTSFRRDLSQPDRLVCFPYAGGTADVYRGWVDRIPGVDVVAAQLRGRDRRFIEPPEDDFERLLDEWETELLPMLSRRTTLFGHSMGGLLAFELARRLEAAGRSPDLVIVSGCAAPSVVAAASNDLDLSDNALLADLADNESVPKEVLANRDLMTLILPVFRADLQVVASYREPAAPPYSGPVRLYYGADDVPPPEQLREEWATYVAGPLTTCGFAGGHFFLKTDGDAVLRSLIEDIRLTEGVPDGAGT